MKSLDVQCHGLLIVFPCVFIRPTSMHQHPLFIPTVVVLHAGASLRRI